MGDRVFLTRDIPGGVEPLLAAGLEVDTWPESLPPPSEALAERAGGADALVCMLTDVVDAALLEGAPRLRVVSQMAVGVDNIDVAAATARGIPVGHTPGVLTETTADLTFALLLAVARRVVEAEQALRAGRWTTWHPGWLLGRDVHGASLGIIGLGAIGQAVARRAAGFGMRILAASRTPKNLPGIEDVGLRRLLSESDFVSVHVALTDETRGLIGEDELRDMKRTAILINTARGPVVDQRALAQALNEGWIAAAGVDVTEVEPIPPDDVLLAAPNCVILPHIGSASVGTRERMARMALSNAIAGLRGDRLPHCVNPEVYEGRGKA